MSVTLQAVIRLIQHNIFVLAVVLLLVACGRGNDETSLATGITPAAGGMVIPTATTSEVLAAVAPEDMRTVSPAIVLSAGQRVRATTTTRLYADATRQSMVMGQFDPATQFTVVVASGEYAHYPVDVDGEAWYRVRTIDGLVGWVPADGLTENN